MSAETDQSAETYGTAKSEVRREPNAGVKQLQFYTVILCCAPFLFLGASLWWLSSAVYRRHVQYPSLFSIGYGTRLHDAKCQIVIDGDSAAMVGIEPAVIAHRTGLKTCNLAEMAGVKLVNGNMVLDDYLAHNQRPRLIVFQFVPENFVTPDRWTQVSGFEGVFFRLQFRPDANFFNYMLQHPLDTIDAVELGVRTGVPWLLRRPLSPDLAQFRDHHDGRMPEPGRTPAECPPARFLRAPDRAYIQQLRAKYGSDGTMVLADVMPEPECSADIAFYRAQLAGVTDDSLGTLPLADYTDTGRLHTNDAGAAALSNRLADQIAKVLAAPTPAVVRGAH